MWSFEVLPLPAPAVRALVHGITPSTNFSVGVGIAADDFTFGVVWPRGGAPVSLATPGNIAAIAFAISDTGVVVGGVGPAPEPPPCVWTNGVYAELDRLVGGAASYVLTLSANGAIRAGYAFVAPGEDFLDARPVFWSGSAITELPLALDFSWGLVRDCNALGNVFVGEATLTAGFLQKAATWTNGVFSVLADLPGATNPTSNAMACNDSGDVVVGGVSGDGLFEAPAMWVNGILQVLPIPAPNFGGRAMSVSTDGSVVGGFYTDGNEIEVPMIWVGGDFDVLPSPGGVSTQVLGVSADGLTLVGGHAPGDIFGAGSALMWVFSGAALPARTLRRWRGQVGLNWLGHALVGDAFASMVGEADPDNFTEYGNPMLMQITSPPLTGDRKRIYVSRLEVDMEVGAGMPNDPTQGPKLMLDFSRDGGITWSTLIRARSMGAIGEYQKRLRFLSLGQSRSWVFRLTLTDPVARKIIGIYLDSKEGTG